MRGDGGVWATAHGRPDVYGTSLQPHAPVTIVLVLREGDMPGAPPLVPVSATAGSDTAPASTMAFFWARSRAWCLSMRAWIRRFSSSVSAAVNPRPRSVTRPPLPPLEPPGGVLDADAAPTPLEAAWPPLDVVGPPAAPPLRARASRGPVLRPSGSIRVPTPTARAWSPGTSSDMMDTRRSCAQRLRWR